MENIEVLEDGCVKITYYEQMGIVSSFHLIEPKLNQLKKRHKEEAEGWYVL